MDFRHGPATALARVAARALAPIGARSPALAGRLMLACSLALVAACSTGGDPRARAFLPGATAELSQMADAALDHVRDSLGSSGRVTEARLSRWIGEWALVRVARVAADPLPVLLHREGGKWRVARAQDLAARPDSVPPPPSRLYDPPRAPAAREVPGGAPVAGLGLRFRAPGPISLPSRDSLWVEAATGVPGMALKVLPASRAALEIVALAEARAEAVARAHAQIAGRPPEPIGMSRGDDPGSGEWVDVAWARGDTAQRVVHWREHPDGRIVRIEIVVAPGDSAVAEQALALVWGSLDDTRAAP